MIDKNKYYVFSLYNDLPSQYRSHLEDVKIDVDFANKEIDRILDEWKDNISEIAPEFKTELLFADKVYLDKYLEAYYKSVLENYGFAESINDLCWIDYRVCYLCAIHFYDIGNNELGDKSIIWSMYIQRSFIIDKYHIDIDMYSQYIPRIKPYLNLRQVDQFNLLPRLISDICNYYCIKNDLKEASEWFKIGENICK